LPSDSSSCAFLADATSVFKLIPDRFTHDNHLRCNVVEELPKARLAQAYVAFQLLLRCRRIGGPALELNLYEAGSVRKKPIQS